MGLRVVHVVRQYHPSRGGMEDVVFNIARFQRELHGHESSVITLNRVFRTTTLLPAHEILEGIPVTRLPYVGFERYPICPSVLMHLREADVVHVHGIDFFYDFLALTRWWHRKPLIACTHGGFFHTEFAQRIKKLFFHSVTRISSLGYKRILATSANDGDIFSTIVDSGRLQIIENGVNVDKYEDAASKSRQPVLLYFGRWSSNKGIPESMQLLKTLLSEDPQWKLIIAGREYDYNTSQLQQMARELGIEHAIDIAPNPSDIELRSLMSQASYFICLSRHEGFGLAAVEAMSAGLIPLLSKIPPYIKLAQETEVPLLIDSDLKIGAEAIIALHSKSEAQYQELRNLAMTRVRIFSWRNVVAAYAAEYERVANIFPASVLSEEGEI